MTQPTPYTPAYSFTDFSSGSPSSQPPGDKLDAEFNAINATLDGTLANLALLQRDDGELANASVGLDQLTAEAVLALATEPGTAIAVQAAADIAVAAAFAGVSTSAAVTVKRQRTLSLLQQSIALANYQPPSLMATLPTIGVATAATGIATGTTWQVATGGVALHANKFTMVGADWKCPSAIFPNTEFYKGEVCRQGNGTDPTTNPNFGGRQRFAIEAPSFELYVQTTTAGSGDGIRVKVDGQYAKSGVIANEGNGLLRFIPIQFGDGTATFRKARNIELDFGSTGGFVGVRTTNLYKPSPWPQANGLRVLQHGDSLGLTIVDSGNKDTWITGATARQISDMIGQADYWASTTGGAGWGAPAVKTISYFNDRVAIDVVAKAPDVIIEHGGGNDAAVAPSQAVEQALVTAWLAAVLTAKPETIIFMIGPMICSNASAQHLTIAAAKRAAAALYPKNVAYIDNLTDPWISGTGKQLTPTGDGNRDWVTGSDGAHPTLEGHAYLASRIVRGVAAAIPALIAAQ